MTVSYDADKVLKGYADIYVGDEDETKPDDDIARGGDMTESATLSWEHVGYTENGLELAVSKETSELVVEEEEQALDESLERVTVLARFTCAEDTIENMQLAWGIGEITVTAAGASQIGKTSMTLGGGLQRKALFFEADSTRDPSAADRWRRCYIPRILSVGSTETGYNKSGKRMYQVEAKAVCPRSDIEIYDKTADATS